MGTLGFNLENCSERCSFVSIAVVIVVGTEAVARIVAVVITTDMQALGSQVVVEIAM